MSCMAQTHLEMIPMRRQLLPHLVMSSKCLRLDSYCTHTHILYLFFPSSHTHTHREELKAFIDAFNELKIELVLFMLRVMTLIHPNNHS